MDDKIKVGARRQNQIYSLEYIISVLRNVHQKETFERNRVCTN